MVMALDRRGRVVPMHRIQIAVILIVTLLGLSAQGVEFCVSPTGNDTWSGRLRGPNAAKVDGPFATLTRARDAIRELRRGQGLTERVTVTVCGGTYFLADTFVLSAEDSGTATCPVTFRAAPGETAVLVGGRAVTGWRKGGNGIYVTSLRDQGITRFRFHQLFFRGQRQVLARHPNLDPEHPHTGGLLYVDEASYESGKAFHYAPGEIPFAEWGAVSQAEVNIYPYNCWDHNIIPIRSVDAEIRHIRLRYAVAGKIREGNRYFIQNVRNALDAPGEWHVDYATGELSFLPPGGSVAEGDVVVPLLENVIAISGTEAEPVRHVNVHGFRFMVAEQDAVTLEGAEHCKITGNVVTNIGGIGINVGFLRNARRGVGNRWRRGPNRKVPSHSGDRSLLRGAVCSDCRVAGNDVDSVGGDGVVLVGSRNRADNNHISRVGLFDMVCAGITVGGDDNVVSHNELHDVPRDAVFVNGGRNTVEFNSIRNSMLYTADNSGIALRQHNVARAVKDLGNVIRFNRILDTIGYGGYPHCTHPPKGYDSPYCSWGIYLDGSICGVTVYGNVIARSGANSIFIQFGGDNVVENNILVETHEDVVQYNSMMFFGWFMHTDKNRQFPQPPNRIQRNIFYYTGEGRKLYLEGLWGHPEWDPKQAVFDHNVIWHNSLPIEVAMDPKHTYSSLADWQAASGHDRHSIVADPLFMDARSDDYRLRPDSPAYQTGFRDINEEIGKIGAYASPERATWPLTGLVPKREVPLVFEYRKPLRPLIDGFELVPLGGAPAKAEVTVEGTSSVAVTDEACSAGTKSLKFTDAAGLEHNYNPHVVYRLNNPEGKQRFAVDIMNSKDAPAEWYMEFRDWRQELFVGPTFRGTSEGDLIACGKFGDGGRTLATIPPGTWFTVGLAFGTGSEAVKTFALTLNVPGQLEQVFHELPFVDAAFTNANWFGISSMSTKRTAFFVDNLILGPAAENLMRDARLSPSIKGLARARKTSVEIRNAEQLALHWDFDDVAADAVRDRSGNGLDGEMTGGALAHGTFGTALLCDGSEAAVETEDDPRIQLGTSDFSIEGWICPTMLGVDSLHPRRRLLDKGLWPAVWWNIDILSSGNVQMEMHTIQKQSGTTGSQGVVSENRWTHVVIVVDRRDFTTTYYLDGVRDSVVDLPRTFTGSLDTLGKSLTTGNWQPFIGLLDELRIYKRALKADEVKAHHKETGGRYADVTFKSETE